jgi:serine protease Do
MKKVLAIGCVAVMALGFTACDFSSFGDSDNKTAYQIAVENGFVGTEKEWLNSLKGANGSNGKDLDIEDVYSAAVEDGFEGSFSDFLKEYLSVSVSEQNDTKLIAQNLMSVVSVFCGFTVTTTTNSGGYGWGWGGHTTQKTEIQCAAGSGVIFSLNKEAGNAYIITNYHVVYDADADNKIADTIYLYLYGGLNMFNTSTGKDEGGSGIQATYVGGAMNYDIAILKVEGSEILQNSDARVADIGSSEAVTVGEKVFAIGNPEGEGISVTSGTLCVDSEYITLTAADEKSTIDFRVMRTDAAINSGNSGGALFNAQGKLIGITNAKNADSEVDNMGYALPITQVMYVVNNILYNVENNNGTGVSRAMLGITVQTSDSKAVYDESTGKAVIVETSTVAEVTSGGAADGYLKTGDVIKSVTINNETTTIVRKYQLIDLMLTVRKGDTIKLTIERDGATQTVEISFNQSGYFTSYT